MKTKPIPAIVMLSAGFVTCIIAIYTHMELMAFTKSLLLVLIVFYILGGIVKIILDKNFAQMKEEEEDDSCFTETLAKIYVKQQRYSKALEIIKKLSLKYPKKNAYFADQIRFLEKLIINANSK